MRAREIEKSIFGIKMSAQKITLLRMRQGFAHQSPITLARSQVLTLNIGSVNFLVAQNGSDAFFGAKDNPATHFQHTSIFTLFINLCLKQLRLYLSPQCLARTTTTSLRRKRLRRAVMGHERSHVSGQLITREQGRAPVSTGFEGRQKGSCRFFVALV